MTVLFITKLLMTSKMKITQFCAILLLVLLPVLADAASTTFGVTFGNPQPNGGACVGKGVCKESVIGDGGDPSAVAVTFTLCGSNPNVLIMRFSMNELTTKQPEQVYTFTDPTGYSFDATYWLNNTAFTSLNLLPNAKVLPNIKYTVAISGDLVSVYIPYSHDDVPQP